ncbi:hypothetical protein BJY04DRAFT_188215 [Aspergillus karnatakaensis]|uniref:uncharacterized protein n=1 Tax=Aspergillus karnatakaensis TaxID=1810916 RepID=UPI003CCE1D23
MILGVDIEQYGARECELMESSDFYLELSVTASQRRYPKADWHLIRDVDIYRILKLAYGPKPEDWQIWVNNPIDELVGEFWEMLEREEEVMPGTWID